MGNSVHKHHFRTRCRANRPVPAVTSTTVEVSSVESLIIRVQGYKWFSQFAFLGSWVVENAVLTKKILKSTQKIENKKRYVSQDGIFERYFLKTFIKRFTATWFGIFNGFPWGNHFSLIVNTNLWNHGTDSRTARPSTQLPTNSFRAISLSFTWC